MKCTSKIIRTIYTKRAVTPCLSPCQKNSTLKVAGKDGSERHGSTQTYCFLTENDSDGLDYLPEETILAEAENWIVG